MQEKKVYRSRISGLLAGILLAIYTFSAMQMFANKIIAGAMVLAVTFLFVGLLLSGIHYVISGKTLHIKLWFISMGRIYVPDIVRISRSYNPISSPAASLKRLCLDQKMAQRFPPVLISPVREAEFISDLKAINPDIKVEVPDKNGPWRIQDWDI